MKFLIHSCLFVAAGASALIGLPHHILGEFAWQPYLLCFAGVLFIYNLDHALDARGGALSDPELERMFVGRRRWAIVFLMALSAAIALVLLADFNPFAHLPALYVAAGAGLLYGLPLVPWRGAAGWRWWRLKDLPGCKAALIAGAVSTAALGLPLAYAAYPARLLSARAAELAGAFGFLSVYTFSNALMFDLRDRIADGKQGLRTLPVLIGPRRSRGLILALNAAAALGLLLLWTGGAGRPHPEWLGAMAYTLAYSFLLQENTSRTKFSLVVDGGLFLPGLLGLLHGRLL